MIRERLPELKNFSREEKLALVGELCVELAIQPTAFKVGTTISSLFTNTWIILGSTVKGWLR